MQALDRITVDPALLNGQPCLRGMRLTVRRVLEIVALYPDARLCREGVFRRGSLFQSARPAWGATSRAPNVMSNQEVSIRAPRVGRDGRQVQREQGTGSFNPRAPRGARLQKLLNYFCLNISNAYSAKFKKSGVNNMTSRRLEFSKNYRSTAFAKSDPIQKSLIAWGSRCNQTINV